MADEQKQTTSATGKKIDRAAAKQAADTNAESVRVSNERRSVVHASDLEGAETAMTLEEANEKGFLGVKVDPRPNEDYTVAGVTKQNG